jgi:hypothetical protein
MGCPSRRQDLANLRTGNPTPHPGYPRPNKSEHPGPHREPIRRNNGLVPIEARANHSPDYRAPAANANDARLPPPERSRPPLTVPANPVFGPGRTARLVTSEQVRQLAPFSERACLRLSASELRRRAKTVQRGPFIRSAKRLCPGLRAIGHRKR